MGGAKTTGAVAVRTEIWACPVTGSGSVTPQFTWNNGVYYAQTVAFDVAGVAATSYDDGVSNAAYGTGTSLSVSLRGAGASQANELLLVAGAQATFNPPVVSWPSGYTTIGVSSNGPDAYTIGAVGANAATETATGNGTAALDAVIAAFKR